MLTSNQLIGFGAKLTLPTLNYITYYGGAGGNNTTVNASLGVARADRYIVACISVMNGDPAYLTDGSVVIAGVTATTCSIITPDQRHALGIFIAAVPTGTTGNISFTGTNGNDYYSMGVYALYGVKSPTPVLATQSNAVTLSLNSTTVSANIALAGTWLAQSGKVWSAPFTQAYYYSPQGTVSSAYYVGMAAATATINFTAGGYGAENLILCGWR